MPFTPLSAPNQGQDGFTPLNAPAANAETPPTDAAPQQDDILNNPLTRVIQAVFPGKEIGEAIGTLGGYGLAAAQDLVNHLQGVPSTLAKNYDLSAPTPAQTTGDAIAALSTPMLGAADSVAGNAALGGAAALGSHVATGDEDFGHALEAGAAGAAGAGALSAVGNTLAPLLAKLPTRIAQKALSGTTPETAEYALKNVKLAPIAQLLSESKAATESGGKQIEAILSHPDTFGSTITSSDIVPKFADAMPNAGMDDNQLQSMITRLIPTQKTMVQKLFSEEGLSLNDTNKLRIAIDDVVKPVYINGKKVDAPAVAASKQIGAAFAGALRSTVKESAPETQPLFARLQQEIQLRNALAKTSLKLDKRVPVGLYDILSGIGGLTASGGNPVGAALAVGAEKAARSPGVQLGTAKVASKILPPAIKAVGTAVRAAKAPVINAASR